MGKNVFIQCILESSYESRKTAKPYKGLKQNNGCRKVFGSRCSMSGYMEHDWLTNVPLYVVGECF